MKYIKTYELFKFLSKGKTWQEKFQDIYNWYLKNKDKKDISVLDLPHADIDDKSLSIAQRDIHLVFYGKTGGNRNMELVDFSKADYADPKSTKGVYPVTQDVYDEYKKKIQEISDWLDERSEKEFGKSGTTISDGGDLDLDFDEADLALEEINDKVKSELDIIGKEYEFELSYHLWTSGSTNKLVVERRQLPIDGLKFGFGGSRFYCQLFTKDPFGEKAEIWLESSSSSEYYDFDEHKWPYHGDKNKIIKMSSIRKEMTRKEEREFEKNRKYPYAFSYEITPCKWESMELIKDITSLLQQMNDGLKK
jgi:hypothetical protein